MARRLVRLLFIVLLIWGADNTLSAQTDATGSKLVAIVCSDSSFATERSLKGIKQTFTRSSLDVQIEEINLKYEGNEKTTSKINLLKPDLVVTVGSPSTIFIKENFPDIPLIFSTVLNPETSGILDTLSGRPKTVTGASLDIPIDIQFQKFKMVHPNLKRVGVIYTKQTEKLIEEAQKIAPTLGLELVAIKIESEREMPLALDSICRVADGIWTTADDLIYTPQATKFMILSSIRNRKPIMGFTPSFVESGALVGLSYDYKDIGRRAGQLAIRYINGEPIDSLPIAAPGVIYLHLNLNTAKQMGIVIDQSLVDISKGIYK